ncbi:G-patch domain and KOW motifs-containing protein-like isoform X1 [Salvelinus namaycush]|uniref:G-patch domain and KOW motifs-containing protein n=1 Tax=Salvelinus namaycush TaxID=8040 RepID=A0A8U1BYY3_SALNM|nr:G-patch domain and KOW motifs-containing protein-like isoform X1 [Salvelinus namaycush]
MASSQHEQYCSNVDTSTSSVQQQGDRKAGAISFGFSKTLSKFKSTRDEAIDADERDYLTGVDGKELLSTKPVEKPKELIIPLIQRNRWCSRQENKAGLVQGQGDGGGVKAKTQPPSQEQDSVESQAVKEIIEESQRQLDQWKNGDQADPNLTIPLLMQNQAPQGFEDGDHIKVDLRPESSTEADYDSVPVEAYGLAMLKGMGWKAGEGIGRTFKQDVKPIEHQLRPKGLGLGADRSSIRDLEPSGPRRPPKPGDERKEETLILGPGGHVLVESGAHKDLYGKIEGVDPDNARVVVKLAIGSKTVTISQYALKLVDRTEYDKNCKDLSRLSRAHKEKEKEKERQRREEKEKERNNEDERKKGRSSERDRDGGKDQRKRKHRDSSQDREKPMAKLPPASPPWLQRDLKVRFVDKAFKGGRYYNSKMRIEDVLTPNICVCRTEEGRFLDDVKQTMLETIVPKSDSEDIMVVLGEHRGQVGRILQRDRDRSRAMVQLDRYEEKVFTLDYDSICHYVGGGDN